MRSMDARVFADSVRFVFRTCGRMHTAQFVIVRTIYILFRWKRITIIIITIFYISYKLYNTNDLFLLFSDPVLHSSTGERSDVRTILQKLILEEDQFAVEDILPNTVPDPASLQLTSEYACPAGQVVMVPDCGKCLLFAQPESGGAQ